MTEATVTLTRKGLVYIPKEMQKKLGLKQGQKVRLRMKVGEICLDKAPSLLELAGTLKPLAKKYQGKDLRELMEKNYRRK